MSVEHLGNITVTFVSYGAVLCLFHDRRSPVVALVVLMLIFRPLLLAESALSSLFLPLVFIPLLVWFVSYAASDARLIKHRTLIVLTAIALHGIMNLMQSNSIQEFTLQLTLWLGFAVLAEAHHQNNSPAEHTVLKILDPTSEKISEKVVLERIVAVIAAENIVVAATDQRIVSVETLERCLAGKSSGVDDVVAVTTGQDGHFDAVQDLCGLASRE